MNRTLLKIICLLLALSLTVTLAGCGGEDTAGEEGPAEGSARPDDGEEDPGTEAEEASEEDDGEEASADVKGSRQGTAKEIQATYQADHIFSLNTMAGESFNPYTTTSAWNRVVSMLVYDTLVATDGNFEAQPNLVTRWETADGIAWTFYVDTSRKFHDGGTMTAGDAVYSIDTARNSYDGRYTKRFSHIRSLYAAGTEAFVVELDQPNWRFYELLNIPCIETGTLGYEQPPGTGPYKFNSRGTSLVLDANHPNAKKIPLNTIHLKRYTDPEDILQAFEDSLLDLVTNNPADMSSLGYSSANLIKYVDTTNMHYLGFNTLRGLFSQPIYRSLITYAIDRESIISTSYQGSAVAATMPIHPNSILYPRTLAKTLAYSEENLAIALQNSGAQDLDMDGVLDFGQLRGEIVFLVCSDSTAKVAAARQIATQLRNVGFSVIMSELKYDDYINALTEGRFDIYYGEVKICNDWDLSELVAANGSLNYGGVRDPNLEGFLQAFVASSTDTIQANSEALYTYFAQCAPITAICFEKLQVLYHRGVLTTIEPTQDNIFNKIEEWTVDLGTNKK